MQVIIFSLLYDIVWPLNYYAVLNVHRKSPDDRFYDDYTISATFLFAACFGLFASFFLKKIKRDANFEHSDYSAVFALFGSFFIFFTFSCITVLFSMKSSPPDSVRNYVWL